MSNIIITNCYLANPWTVAATITWLQQRDDLSETARRDCISSLNSVVRIDGRPASDIIFTPQAIGTILNRGSAKSFGLKERRLFNIRSHMRAIFRDLGLPDTVNASLSPEWALEVAKLDSHHRNSMIGMIRFFSESGFSPATLPPDAADLFLAHLTSDTLSKNPRKRVGAARAAWNKAIGTIPGWPQQRLEVAKSRITYQLPLTAFPGSFQDDVAAFRRSLARDDLKAPLSQQLRATGPLKPVIGRGNNRGCKQSTVNTRTDHIRWAASALVASGCSLERVSGLECLVDLDNAHRILNFILEQAGEKPSTTAMHVAEVLLMIARHHVVVPPAVEARLTEWLADVRVVYSGITTKNRRAVMTLSQPSRLGIIVNLPAALMEAAYELLKLKPKQAASMAMRAVAISLFNYSALRLQNVIGLRLDHHLQRPRPGQPVSHLDIPATEVKNGVALIVPIAADLGRLIDQWIKDFRPIIAMPNNPYLFPGSNKPDAHVTPQGMRDAVKATMLKHVGHACTPHQFRHLLAKLHLDTGPGGADRVTEALGHKDRQTVLRSYGELNTARALGIYQHDILGRYLETSRNGRRPSKVSRPSKAAPQKSKPKASPRAPRKPSGSKEG